MLWVLVLLNAADVVSTRLGIRAGLEEANPIMAPFADSWVSMSIVKVIFLLPIIILARRWPTEARPYVTGLTVFYALLVANNLILIS